MQAMIDELAKQAEESLGQVSSKETLATFWQEYLSKNGKRSGRPWARSSTN